MGTETENHENGADGVPLRELLLTVGDSLMAVLAAPAGLDTRVGNVVIVDPDDESEAFAGDLVLLIGARGGAARHLIRAAGRHGAAAVAVKVDAALHTGGSPPPGRGSVSAARPGGGDEVEQLRSAASDTGVALLAVRPEVRWDHLQSLCRSVVEEGWLSSETDLVDSAGDLSSLAQSISTLAGGLVAIEDAASRVLAYSSGEEGDELRRLSILGRRGPEQYLALLREWGVFSQLRSGEEVVHIDERPELGIRRRIAVGVRAGSQPLGTIWVQEGSHPLAERAEEALLGAARVTALHMVRHRTKVSAGLRLQEDLLAGLLEGRIEPAALSDTIDVTPERTALVVAFAPTEPGGHSGANRVSDPGGADRSGWELKRRRMIDLISVHAAAYRHTALVTTLGGRVYVLLPDVVPRAESSVLTLTRKTVWAARGMFGVSVQGAVGSPVDALDDILRSRVEADRILDAMGRDLAMDVATISEVRARVLVSETLAHLRESPALRDPRIDRLIEHDEGSGTKLVPSLLAYLEDFGDVRGTAQRLHVHPNTLRYRLRRAESVSGIDLSDPHERLFTQLQLLMERDG